MVKANLGDQTDLVSRAHRYGLKVHTYTMRNEDAYLAWDYNQDPVREYELFLSMRVDGYFTDFPETMKRVVDLNIGHIGTDVCRTGNLAMYEYVENV